MSLLCFSGPSRGPSLDPSGSRSLIFTPGTTDALTPMLADLVLSQFLSKPKRAKKDVKSRKEVYLGFGCFSFPGILLFFILVTVTFFSLGTLFRLVQLKPILFYTRWACDLGQLKFIFLWSQRLVQGKDVTQAEAIKALARTFSLELLRERSRVFLPATHK